MIDTVVKEVGQEICLNDNLSPVISIFHYILVAGLQLTVNRC